MTTFSLIILFVGVSLCQSAILVKKKARRELIIFLFLQSCAFTLSLLYILGLLPVLSHQKFHQLIIEKLLKIKY